MANSQLGGIQGVNYLVSRGYKRIAFIGGLLTWASARERQEGYRQGMIEAGLRDHIQIVPGDWSLESGRHAALALLQDSNPPEAIFAANDVTAIGVLQVARELGLSIPGDLAVMGYDDFTLASLISPTLTTIHMPAYEIGLKAAELILAYQESGYFSTQTVFLDTQVVIRESS